jgi:hypothetical protein
VAGEVVEQVDGPFEVDRRNGVGVRFVDEGE